MIQRHPRETEFFIETRAFVTNNDGDRVLAGLTSAETDDFFAYRDQRASGMHPSKDAREKHLKLAEIHERARLAIVVAEVESRNATKN